MNTGKIIKIEYISDWHKNGHWFKYNVEFKHGNFFVYRKDTPLEKLNFKVGDDISFDEIKDSNGDPCIKNIQVIKTPMFNKYNKTGNVQQYVNPQQIKDNNIYYQSARNCVAQIYSGHGDKVDIEKFINLTEYLYNKHKEFFKNN